MNSHVLSVICGFFICVLCACFFLFISISYSPLARSHNLTCTPTIPVPFSSYAINKKLPFFDGGHNHVHNKKCIRTQNLIIYVRRSIPNNGHNVTKHKLPPHQQHNQQYFSDFSRLRSFGRNICVRERERESLHLSQLIISIT